MDWNKDKNKNAEQSGQDPNCCPGDQNPSTDSPDCCGSSPPAGTQGNKFAISTLISLIIIVAAIGVAAHSIIYKDDSGCFQNPDCVELKSFASLDKLATDKDFVFILLPGAEEESSGLTTRLIEEASKTISRNGIKVGTFTMNHDSPDYPKLVNAFKIKKLPAILAMGKGCGSVTITGDITQEKLIAGYKKASQSGGGRSSSCCPKSKKK